MNGYERILRKAIAGLGESDAAARHVVYERARAAVLKQLRALDPPKSDAEIDAQIAALHAAVKNIEDELAPAVPARQGVPPRRMGLAIAVGLAAMIVAAAGAYLFATRERAPKPVARTAPARSAPAAVAAVPAADPMHASFILRRQRVFYRTTHPPGSVIVSRDQRFLYVVQPNQVAIRYAIGVGQGCASVAGLFRVTEKHGAPATAAPGQKAAFELPALYFDTARAVHRTAEPARIGESTKGGCFQAWDSDIADLYERVQLNDRVVIAN